MRHALHAEWTKLRTTAGPAWLLLAAVAAIVAIGAAVAACPRPVCDLDPVRLSLTGIYLGQAPVAILAVLAISGEHSTGLIRATLTAVPRRPAVLAAKATVLTLTVATAAGVALLATFLITREITDGPALRAYGVSVSISSSSRCSASVSPRPCGIRPPPSAPSSACSTSRRSWPRASPTRTGNGSSSGSRR